MPERFIPPTPELHKIRDILSKHALSKNAILQRTALEYIFSRVIRDRENCRRITALDIAALPRPEDEHEPANAPEAANNLIRAIRRRLDAFYGEGKSSGKIPHQATQKIHYRVDIPEEGNYVLSFKVYIPKQPEADLVQAFWKPHLPPQGTAKILFVEPLFFMDRRGTFFRNPAMSHEGDKDVLSYLNISDLEPGYSYVPAGIVQALLVLTQAIRRCYNDDPEIPAYEVIKPTASNLPARQDFIVLATPTSTRWVEEILQGQKMTVNSKGVHYQAETWNDSGGLLRGVATRLRMNGRIITLLAAKHGRCIETMVQWLTEHARLAAIVKQMGRVDFPDTFQVMFSMPVVSMGEGPYVKDTVIQHVEPKPEGDIDSEI